MARKIRVSDYITEFLADRGITCVFGLAGGAITRLVDSLCSSARMRFVPVYHEQTAAIAAEGYSRYSGRVGAATATSGPGATNLITGIADAYFDSIPCLFLTGQVNTCEFKYGKPIRQQGFQETDIVSIVRPIVKYAALVDDPALVGYHLEKAYREALGGRPGPVLLDIPMDVQGAMVDGVSLTPCPPDPPPPAPDEACLDRVAEMVRHGSRPLILAGGGVLKAGAGDALFHLSVSCHIPVVSSLMGKGAFPEDHPLYAGMIGSYGHRCANIILANAGVLLAVGTRLDTRQTGTALESFVRGGRVVHVDIDGEEILGHRLPREVGLAMDAGVFLAGMSERLSGLPPRREWLDYVERIKAQFSQEEEIRQNVKNPLPYRAMEAICRLSPNSQAFFADTGQNQVIAAQVLKIYGRRRFFTSGGLAPMGFAIPAAAGACFAAGKEAKFTAITGDGGFHISSQALMLLSQHRLPVKVLVLNNRSLGMIAQFQDLYFDGRRAATTEKTGYRVPCIGSLARAYGLDYHRVDAACLEGLGEMLAMDGPSVIEVDTGGDTTAAPKLEVGRPVEDTGPPLPRDVLRESMLIPLYGEEPRDGGGAL